MLLVSSIRCYDFSQSDMLIAEAGRTSFVLQMDCVFRAVVKACVAHFAVVREINLIRHSDVICRADLRAGAAQNTITIYDIALSCYPLQHGLAHGLMKHVHLEFVACTYCDRVYLPRCNIAADLVKVLFDPFSSRRFHLIQHLESRKEIIHHSD